MDALAPKSILAMRLERDGTAQVTFDDGRGFTWQLGRVGFGPTSAIAETTCLLSESKLALRTVQGDEIIVELPSRTDLAPVGERSTVYLDQNHWSTLTNAIYEPTRVANKHERDAANELIELVEARRVVLPMSSAHMAETCKQVDARQRYRRALTIARLSAGWQMRDPLHIRQLELEHALCGRYSEVPFPLSAAITLEPHALTAGRDTVRMQSSVDLPAEMRWISTVVTCFGGLFDTMLDAKHVEMIPTPGWTAEFQRFATFLKDNPTDAKLKRRRTHAKFVTDLGAELAKAAHSAGITPEQMYEWALNYSEQDVCEMPTLGLYREVIHEKLSDSQLIWRDNDLVDMMYLTAAAGYCDHVVAERTHASHIQNSHRRLQRVNNIHRNLRSLISNL